MAVKHQIIGFATQDAFGELYERTIESGHSQGTARSLVDHEYAHKNADKGYGYLGVITILVTYLIMEEYNRRIEEQHRELVLGAFYLPAPEVERTPQEWVAIAKAPGLSEMSEQDKRVMNLFLSAMWAMESEEETGPQDKNRGLIIDHDTGEIISDSHQEEEEIPLNESPDEPITIAHETGKFAQETYEACSAMEDREPKEALVLIWFGIVHYLGNKEESPISQEEITRLVGAFNLAIETLSKSPEEQHNQISDQQHLNFFLFMIALTRALNTKERK